MIDLTIVNQIFNLCFIGEMANDYPLVSLLFRNSIFYDQIGHDNFNTNLKKNK